MSRWVDLARRAAPHLRGALSALHAKLLAMLAGVLALAGCPHGMGPGEDAAPEPLTTPIACALHGAADLAPGCSAERFDDADGELLILHSGDGGFRRLRLVGDRLVSADGRDPAVLRGREISIGPDRYMLPKAPGGHDRAD